MRLINLFFVLSAVTAFGQEITVQVDGRPVGTEKVLNLMPGAGVLHACVDKPAEHRVDCAPSFNTAVIATHDTIHANENYCLSTNGTSNYTCKLPNRPLTNYSAGMTFVLAVDSGCTGACSVNIDNVGIVSIKKIDGASQPGDELKAGQPQWIFYDGKVFRLMGGAGGSISGDQRGDVRARRVIAAMDTVPYQAAITLDVTAGDLHKIRTAPGGGNAVINTSTVGLPGQHMWIIIANDATSSKTISFGANILSAGPITGAVGKSATLHFVSDGTAWYEVSRTTGL